MTTLILPYPPSANRYWRIFRGRAVPSAEAALYKRLVWAVARSSGMSDPTTAPVALALILRPVRPLDGDKRERLQGPGWHLSVRCIDLDNALKVALDALQGIAYANDKQVMRIRIERGVPVNDGALEISWTAMEAA
jgi:crossover junction endodeoxyribonuclease RusA